MFPNAVINDDQNPSTPFGRCVGDIVIDTFNLTSEMLRTLTIQKDFLISIYYDRYMQKFKHVLYGIPNFNDWINGDCICFRIVQSAEIDLLDHFMKTPYDRLMDIDQKRRIFKYLEPKPI